MKRRLTRRASIVALVAGVLFLAGATAQASWLFVIAAGVLGLVVGSLFVRHPLKQASVERTLPRRTRVGDDIRVGVVVRNEGRRALPLMRLDDRFGGVEPSALLIERLKPGQTSHVELVKRATRRGAFASGEVALVSGAPFGFVRTTRALEVASEMVVVPTWVDLRSFPILEPSSFPADVLHERSRTGAGEEFIGVRDYRPGDPPRHVHWRSTARAGHLVVREFEEEVASRVCLVLAGADTGAPPDSAFEALVRGAASVGIYALKTGHPIEMVTAAPGGEIERIVDPDRFGLLDFLARVRPVDNDLPSLAGIALSRIGRKGTVVLFSPTAGRAGASVREAMRVVRSAGSWPVVIVARSSSWLDSGGRIEEERLDELAESSTSVRVVARGEDMARCIGS